LAQRVTRLRAVPLAPKPSRATLTARKAKWYHWVTENSLVRLISKANVAAERRAKPRYVALTSLPPSGAGSGATLPR
jgi:hypothetical protein